MGLDMYLKREIYIGANYEHRNVTGEVSIFIDSVKQNIDLKKISIITMHVGYWRKANQIHAWFVDNVQDCVDNCEQYHVSWKQLQELKELCKKVLETKETNLLPPRKGFFFGNDEIDEYYWEDLMDTIKLIESLDEAEDYYYRSSW